MPEDQIVGRAGSNRRPPSRVLLVLAVSATVIAGVIAFQQPPTTGDADEPRAVAASTTTSVADLFVEPLAGPEPESVEGLFAWTAVAELGQVERVLAIGEVESQIRLYGVPADGEGLLVLESTDGTDWDEVGRTLEAFSVTAAAIDTSGGVLVLAAAEPSPGPQQYFGTSAPSYQAFVSTDGLNFQPLADIARPGADLYGADVSFAAGIPIAWAFAAPSRIPDGAFPPEWEELLSLPDVNLVDDGQEQLSIYGPFGLRLDTVERDAEGISAEPVVDDFTPAMWVSDNLFEWRELPPISPSFWAPASVDEYRGNVLIQSVGGSHLYVGNGVTWSEEFAGVTPDAIAMVWGDRVLALVSGLFSVREHIDDHWVTITPDQMLGVSRSNALIGAEAGGVGFVATAATFEYPTVPDKSVHELDEGTIVTIGYDGVSVTSGDGLRLLDAIYEPDVSTNRHLDFERDSGDLVVLGDDGAELARVAISEIREPPFPVPQVSGPWSIYSPDGLTWSRDRIEEPIMPRLATDAFVIATSGGPTRFGLFDAWTPATEVEPVRIWLGKPTAS